MINKGSKLADFVRFCSDTYARTQQSLPPFWAAMSKIIVENLLTRLILFRMDLFGAAHGWGGAKSSAPLLPKIFHTYPTRIKLGGILPYLRKTQKIYESPDALLEFCWHQHFFLGSQKSLLPQKI